MSHKFNPTPSSHSNQRSLGRSLKAMWNATLRFMVQRPQESAQAPTSSAKERYSAKAALYSYLPNSEEQRDWLERIYRQH